MTATKPDAPFTEAGFARHGYGESVRVGGYAVGPDGEPLADAVYIAPAADGRSIIAIGTVNGGFGPDQFGADRRDNEGGPGELFSTTFATPTELIAALRSARWIG